MLLFTDERNSKITSVVNFTPSKFGSLSQGVLKVHITKPCTTSTKLHPPPPSYNQFHLPPPSSFQPPPSSLQHLQQYSNRNIARNWAISRNLGQKIHGCPFWLKIGTHDILKVLIPNPDLDFWNFNPKIHFWPNLGPNSQSCPLCLKICTHGITRMLILIPTLIFWNSDPKINF